MIRSLLSFLTCVSSCLMAQATTPAADWLPTAYLHEKALISVSHGWKAIVSLERGRLMHFGPAEQDFNLLLAPPTRDNPDLLGGHRVWLGPQNTWTNGWPPPKQWELSGPESFSNKNGELRMLMGDAGDGWPRLTRTYHWNGAKLNCGVELNGGTRSAQIIQIFQTPPENVVTLQAHPAKDFPAGFVILPSKVSKFFADFPPLPQITRTENNLTLRHTPKTEKLGFRPQILTTRNGAFTLTVAMAAQTGKVVGAPPDQGFDTQVYLGGDEPVIELEQLTPLFSPDTPASFNVVLEAKRN